MCGYPEGDITIDKVRYTRVEAIAPLSILLWSARPTRILVEVVFLPQDVRNLFRLVSNRDRGALPVDTLHPPYLADPGVIDPDSW